MFLGHKRIGISEVIGLVFGSIPAPGAGQLHPDRALRFGRCTTTLDPDDTSNHPTLIVVALKQ